MVKNEDVKKVPFKSTPLPHVPQGKSSFESKRRHKSPEPKILEAMGFFESKATISISETAKDTIK